MELPFDDDEVAPLQADDPRPQRVPQFPAGSRKKSRQGSGRGRDRDRELSPKFEWGREYSNPGHPPAFVYVERGPGAGQLVPVQQGPLVLGRSSSSDLRLQHPSISRRHAQLTRQGDDFFLKDLGSQNGTFINRVRVTAEVQVMPGDEISLGNAVLRLRGPGTPSATNIPAPAPAAVLEPAPRRPRMNRLTVALVAAGLGSTAAALFTVLVVGLASNDNGSGAQAREEAFAPVEQNGAPLLVDAPPSRGPGGARSAPATTEEPAGVVTSPGVRDTATENRPPRTATPKGSDTNEVASGSPATREPAPGSRSRVAPVGMSARDIASGRVGPPPSGAPDMPPSSNPTTPSLNAADIAAGRGGTGTGVSRGAPTMSAADIAAGRGVASGGRTSTPSLNAADIASGATGSKTQSPPVSRPVESSTGARDVAMGGTRAEPNLASKPVAAPMQTAEVRPAVEPGTEADVLRRYETGDVTGAVEMARVSKLPALQAQLQRVEASQSEARKAVAKGDLPRAIAQLTTAVAVDQELSHGWGTQGPRLRKQLGDLHVQVGVEAMKTGDRDAARTAFNQALQHDSGNLKAREGLRRLSAGSAP
ncbi:FHA domain-containing protein [Myxococcus sp. K15C18031901]|uniref:FHA domain-containing protein n=1 Tax=Myxococcus dinghuensis TaxID=2906761 RepID=UPI0020A7E5C2|nr:FHA domain-containing protein [Myxococcus dinghuensis]MCP3103192.1 FHA domain-containing protein [Myxococcus dinghuensis]